MGLSSISKWIRTDLGSHRAQKNALFLMLIAALLLRLSLLRWHGHEGDMAGFTNWAKALLRVPFSEFYLQGAPECDSLPGYLYILAATARLHTILVGPIMEWESFELWIKPVPVLADLALGIGVFLLCRRFTSPGRSLIATILVLFNPGLIFMSAIWGQIDSLSAALCILSLMAIVYGSPLVAAVLAGLAFLCKPQYTLFLISVALVYLLREIKQLRNDTNHSAAKWTGWVITRLMLPVICLVMTIQSLLLPFSVSIWPDPSSRWTLLSRLAIAEANFPYTSVNAFNLWATPIAGLWKPDSTLVWLSLSYKSWGIILLSLFIVIVLWWTWANADNYPMWLWSCFLLAFGFFELFTRMHERYLYIAIPLIAILAVYQRSAAICYAAITSLYLVNVWYVYAISQSGPLKNQLMSMTPLVIVPSLFGVVLLIVILVGLVYSALSYEKSHTLTFLQQ